MDFDTFVSIIKSFPVFNPESSNTGIFKEPLGVRLIFVPKKDEKQYVFIYPAFEGLNFSFLTKNSTFFIRKCFTIAEFYDLLTKISTITDAMKAYRLVKAY